MYFILLEVLYCTLLQKFITKHQQNSSLFINRNNLYALYFDFTFILLYQVYNKVELPLIAAFLFSELILFIAGP